MSRNIPVSLYIHIPWCLKKCPYCDFNSHEKGDDFDEARYLQALLEDLAEEHARHGSRPLTSIFFGGGTPSLFAAETIGRLLEAAAASFGFEPDIEISLEANPGTFEQQRFSDYRAAGVNRLSIGIQSFHPAHLRALGRVHDAGQALAAIDTAHSAGFDNFNLDLMFGLPGQTTAEAVADITSACAAGASHLSHYQLTIEPNTLFHRYPPTLPDDDSSWLMQQECQDVLRDAGFEHYEVSAYAREGQTGRHNLNYWQFGDYIGIGAGAHGKLTTRDPQTGELRIVRQRKYRQPAQFMAAAIAGNAISSSEQITADACSFEFLLNALRLKGGCESSLFMERTGLSLAELASRTREIDPALLQIDDRRITTTDRGFLFLNEVLASLL